jgi:hypothetical protein
MACIFDVDSSRAVSFDSKTLELTLFNRLGDLALSWSGLVGCRFGWLTCISNNDNSPCLAKLAGGAAAPFFVLAMLTLLSGVGNRVSKAEDVVGKMDERKGDKLSGQSLDQSQLALTRSHLYRTLREPVGASDAAK